MVERTVSFGDSPGGDGAVGPPRLVRALQWRRLLAPPVVVELSREVEVVLGRGPDELTATPGRLELRTDDDRMSSDHARVRLRDGQWTALDQGSRNGTFVNGARIRRFATAATTWG
jgi:hypothetical protein